MCNTIFKSEVNSLPSMVNTSTNSQGVISRLGSVRDDAPKFDGVTIEQMRGNPLYSRLDDLDKVGAAQRCIEESGRVLRKSEFVRAFNRKMQHPNINNNKL